jgi:hypothetical protein
MLSKEEILNLKINHIDFHKNFTIRDYFCELIMTLWEDKEGFSGKRPFGDSGWEYDLYKPLIINNVIEGRLDDDNGIEYVDKEQANNVIKSLIAYCFYGK